MGESSQSDDVARLRDTFPGWSFGVVWVTAASGPDRRRLVAIRNGITLSAWDADALAAGIRRDGGDAA
jgi:hypothetical protein